MTKPVVHHVITRLIAGGAQENTILSCQALQDRYQILLVTGPPEGREGSLIEDARRRGIEVRVVEELVRPVSPIRDAAALLRLRGIFESGHPDIVHTHSSKAGILGRAAAWAAKVPHLVHTNHGLPFYDGQALPVRALWWALEKAASTVTERVVCVGEEMRRKSIAARLGRPERFEVVYSGIETDLFTGAASCRECLGIPSDAPVVGMVSRMAKHKGHRYLVEAAPPGVHLLFVGDGEEREAVERLVAARGLKATFAGHVPPEAVPDLIASMDVLVHPSIWEGLPRAAVQALLVGRPVVAFDCDGAREVVVDGVTGRLVPPRSVDGLSAAIRELLGRADRGGSLGVAGRDRVIRRFDWRAAGEQLADLYARLLGGGLEMKQTV
ncbi:MAG: glycosyltransferase family 4 protein [Planctomycetes bacterium]|nr:glycosyltransferase family 4 protein [Planctomycetota bacterium]